MINNKSPCLYLGAGWRPKEKRQHLSSKDNPPGTHFLQLGLISYPLSPPNNAIICVYESKGLGHSLGPSPYNVLASTNTLTDIPRATFY